MKCVTAATIAEGGIPDIRLTILAFSLVQDSTLRSIETNLPLASSMIIPRFGFSRLDPAEISQRGLLSLQESECKGHGISKDCSEDSFDTVIPRKHDTAPFSEGANPRL